MYSQKGDSIGAIVKRIGVNKSTVSRELRRNSTPNGKYLWLKADSISQERKKRCRGIRRLPEALVWRIKDLITQKQWSPRQISGYLLKNEGTKVSHESIYSIIRKDESGLLADNCRHKMKYNAHNHTKKETKDRVSIHQRPAEADGKRFVDWKMDLIVDKDSNAILTIAERSSNFALAQKLEHGKKAEPLAKVVWRLLLPYKGKVLKTTTTDNGSEFACHKWITEKLGVPVYITDSYASWQKGAIENTNKLIRQYIPKGQNIAQVSPKKTQENYTEN